jgi:hypothetical protein
MSWSLLRPSLPIDRDELDWQLATFKWMIAEFGPVAGRPLVLPLPAFFPASRRTGHDRVEDLFHQVKHLAGMADWPCNLRPGRESRPIDAGNTLLIRHEGAEAPCGTFQIADEDGAKRVVVTYNPSMAGDTDAMIATFAHELGHYLMSNARTVPPGGWVLHELHTDLVAVGLGFGIFLANSARNFSQFQNATEMGWSSQTQGYLSEGALVTATALFQLLAGRDPMEARPWLKPYLQSDLKRAVKGLARLVPDVPGAVEAVDLSEFASD